MIRERRKHVSRNPISTALAVRAVKTKIQETQSLRIAGYFFVWAVDGEKVCQLCKQEMLVTAGHAECTNSRVASRHHILAKKILIMSQGKFKGLSLNYHGICGSSK